MMTPEPAPVTTIQPSCTMRWPKSRAVIAAASLTAVRAEPNTVTLRTARYGANTL